MMDLAPGIARAHGDEVEFVAEVVDKGGESGAGSGVTGDGGILHAELSGLRARRDVGEGGDAFSECRYPP